MPATQTTTDARTALRAATVMIAQRLEPGRGVPEARHLALLAEAEAFLAPPLWTDGAALALSAVYVARARRDVLSGDTDLVTRYFEGMRLVRPASLSSSARAQLFASVGEYCCALGRGSLGARYAAEALLFADSPALQYRAHTVMALGFAINGEIVSCELSVREARRLFAENAWPLAEMPLSLPLSEAMVASARMDKERLALIVREMTSAQPDDPYWQYAARAIDVMRQLLLRDCAGGLATSWELLNGSSRHSSNHMVRDYLFCLRADILTAQGNCEESLTMMATRASPTGHSVCFALHRAGNLLQLGRDRELLAETDGCVTAVSEHCLRTLTPVLLRRAIAYERLGASSKARDSMVAAMLLMARTGDTVSPFALLPRDETLSLVEAAVHKRQELSNTAAFARAVLAEMCATPHEDQCARKIDPFGLTPTERALAEILETRASLPQIARDRGVSVNTVKSQVRSIYLKLGVGGRAEATETLRRFVA